MSSKKTYANFNMSIRGNLSSATTKLNKAKQRLNTWDAALETKQEDTKQVIEASKKEKLKKKPSWWNDHETESVGKDSGSWWDEEEKTSKSDTKEMKPARS